MTFKSMNETVPYSDEIEIIPVAAENDNNAAPLPMPKLTGIPGLPGIDDKKYLDVDTIKVEKTITRFYIYGAIGNDEDWFYPLLKKLDKATENDIIEIHLNSPGGMVYPTLQLIGATRRCKGKLSLYVSGACMSAATIITFGGTFDEVFVDEYTSFLFHNGCSFEWGKPNDVLDGAQHYRDRLVKLFNDIYSEVLTKTEIKQILDGRELYLGGDEVLARLEESHAKREAKKEARKAKKSAKETTEEEVATAKESKKKK